MYLKNKQKKERIKSSILSLDFAANLLQQEHVQDSTVTCSPAVHEQLHNTTVPQKKRACFVAPDKGALNKCACMHERL